MNTTPAIRDWLARNRQRVQAIVLRGLAQAIGTVPPLVVLATHGASGFGLFSILIAAAGLSVVLEWGLPQKVQNEISRGQTARIYDLRWFLVDSGFLVHLTMNLACAVSLWYVSSLWLVRLFPMDVAQVLAGNDQALLAIFLIAGGVGASYQGRSVLFGLGHIDKGFSFTLAGAVASLLLVIAGIAAGASIALLAVLVSAAPLLERLFACAYCFRHTFALARHPSMPPALAVASVEQRRPHVAPMFLYLQVLSLVANNIDSIYAARANSLRSVGEYAFLLKLYGIPLLIVNILSTAALPRLAVEAHDGQTGGRHTVLALLRSNVAFMGACGLVIVFSAGMLYKWITGSEADLRILAALMLVDTTVLAMRVVLTTYVNAAEVLWLNVVGNSVFAAAAIVLKVVLVDRYGIAGLVLANIVAYLVFLLPFHVTALMRTSRR